MRTTIDIDEDILLAAKALASKQRRSAGSIISELARKGLSGGSQVLAESNERYGFNPLPKRGVIVTDELVESIRKELGD